MRTEYLEGTGRIELMEGTTSDPLRKPPHDHAGQRIAVACGELEQHDIRPLFDLADQSAPLEGNRREYRRVRIEEPSHQRQESGQR